jgi:hypothetical protein
MTLFILLLYVANPNGSSTVTAYGASGYANISDCQTVGSALVLAGTATAYQCSTFTR